MNQRPGFMLYFELSPALETLDDRAAGRLLKALMAYAQYGELRELDGMESLAFLLMRGRIDRDAETYREKCRKNAYNAYAAAARRRGELPLEYEDWVDGHSCANACERMPTITTTTDTTTDPDPSPDTDPNTKSMLISNPAPNPAPAADRRAGAARTRSDDTGWVLDYLEQRGRNRGAKGGTQCQTTQRSCRSS